MKVAFNQNNIWSYPLDEIYEDPCYNCIFRLENDTCILADFIKDNFNNLFDCCNGIFISESLSDVFKL